jgi:hypothetical protein
MTPLIDMLTNAQNGRGMELLARQFNLSQQQAQLAVEALLPAFSQGLKRNASDPYGLAAFLGAMANGSHNQYFADAQKAFSPQGIQNGNDVLGQIFGSKDLSRAVAMQAAQATGLGQEMMKQMLPVIASMLMGGFAAQAAPSQASADAGNPFGQIIEQMMRQAGGMAGGAARPAEAPSSPFDNPFGKILEGMLGGGAGQASQAQPQAGQNPFGDNPFGKIFEEMLGGGRQSAPEEEPAPAPRQRRRAEPDAPDAPSDHPFGDIFGKMFETGAKHREDYQKGVESIFDQFTKGMDRYK